MRGKNIYERGTESDRDGEGEGGNAREEVIEIEREEEERERPKERGKIDGEESEMQVGFVKPIVLRGYMFLLIYSKKKITILPQTS